MGIAATALSTSLWVTLPVLVVVGLSWIGVIATLNGTVQAFLPEWVRTRGLSVYQLVLFGGTALGAAVIGALGSVLGTAQTMAGAGAVVVLGAALLLLLPLHPTADKNRASFPMPLTDVPPVATPLPGDDDDTDEADPDARKPDLNGSTLVIVRYEIADGDRAAFLATMHAVEQSRRRTGARRWNVYDDRERPGYMIEAFEVGSWQEHLSQHHTRTTGYDAEIVDAARALSQSPPTVEHLIAAPLTRRASSSTAASPPEEHAGN